MNEARPTFKTEDAVALMRAKLFNEFGIIDHQDHGWCRFNIVETQKGLNIELTPVTVRFCCVVTKPETAE